MALGESWQGDAASNVHAGTDFDDVLEGLEGNDVLDGGAGNDTLYGDFGAGVAPQAGAIDLDGSGDRIVIANFASLDITGNITVEAWVRLDGTQPGFSTIIAKGDWGYQIRMSLQVPGAIEFITGTPGGPVRGVPAISTTHPDVGTWYHVAGVVDGNQQFLYINGQLESTVARNSTSIESAPFELWIGGNAEMPGRDFNGAIADVRVWSVARSGSEIAASLNERLAGTEPGLQGNWLLDSGQGGFGADHSARGNNGQVVGNPTSTEAPPIYAGAGDDILIGGAGDDVLDGGAGHDTLYGDFGPGVGPQAGAIDLDGSGDRIAIANSASLDITGNITVEAWVRLDGTQPGFSTIIAKGDWGYQIRMSLQVPGAIEFITGTPGGPVRGVPAISTTHPDLGTWYHVAGVVDGNQQFLYINGQLESTVARNSTSIESAPFELWIGGNAEMPGRDFNGAIADVRVWSVARSGSEIAASMGSRLAGTEAGLQGNWLLDSGQGGFGADHSARGNNGQIVGNPTSTEAPPTYAGGGDDILIGGVGDDVLDGGAGNDTLYGDFGAGVAPQAGAIDLDGSGDRIVIANFASLDITGNITVEAWVRLDGTQPGFSTIIAKGDWGYQIRMSLQVPGAIEFITGTPGGPVRGVPAISTTHPDVGTWYHVAGVVDGNQQFLYINGQLESTVARNSTSIESAPFELWIGGNAEMPGRDFNGAIADVRVWSVARSGSEIAASLNERLAGTEPGLQGNWLLDSGQGGFGADHSARGNNGQVVGNPTSTEAPTTYAGAGDDTLIGGAGDDTLNGGGGNDVAVFSGSAAQYLVIRNGSLITVTDMIHGRDGSDTLSSIERLQFAEQTIVLGNAVVSLSTLAATKAEDDSSMSFTFVVTRSGDSSLAQSVSYQVSGSGLNAATGADFLGGLLPSGVLAFVPGETTTTLTVSVLVDTLVEPDEGFVVTLSNASAGLAIGAATASGIVQNDDRSTVSIVPLSAVRTEGNDGPAAFTFIVSLDQPGVFGQTISWAVSGSGSNGVTIADFGGLMPSGVLTFVPGEMIGTLTVSVSGDTIVEPDEGFVVTLSNASAGLAIGTATASGIILNDDRSTVSVAPLSAVRTEGSDGPAEFTFTVSLDQPGVTELAISWAVSGSGSNGVTAADFNGLMPSGVLTFVPGEMIGTLTVSVSGDTLVEPDEGFVVTLSNASAGLAIGAATASGIIQNDDRSTVSIVPLSAVRTEGNDGPAAFTFTVSLDQPGVIGQTISWAVSGNGANGVTAADFGGLMPSGVLTFVPGEMNGTLTVSVSGDTLVEPDEGFVVTLSNASAGLAIGTATTSGIILNDDRSTVSIAPLSAIRTEGNDGPTAFTFTVSLDQPGVTGQTISWAVSGSGANGVTAADFGGTMPSGALTFVPGEMIGTLTVSVSGDTIVEPDEGFVVTLSNASAGLVIGTATASRIIQNDDAMAVHNDAYILLPGQILNVTANISVLANDENATTAALSLGPAHGTLQLASDGGFSYVPTTGFSGTDTFTYHASNGNALADGSAVLYIVPVLVGTTTTLNLQALNAEQQIAATYAAFFGRAADLEGHEFWVDQFNSGLATQGIDSLFANIASSFGISMEAKALYPFLANPFGAGDLQINEFVDGVYNNLFNRSPDDAGLAYWTGQIRQTLQSGQFVGSVLINIMSGSQAGMDITTLMGKVAVSLAFVHEQREHHTIWQGSSDNTTATALLQSVTADPMTVLIGIRNAETLIAEHV